MTECSTVEEKRPRQIEFVADAAEAFWTQRKRGGRAFPARRAARALLRTSGEFDPADPYAGAGLRAWNEVVAVVDRAPLIECWKTRSRAIRAVRCAIGGS